MPMVILQFQFTNTTDEEQDLVPKFCNWLSQVIYSNIDTKINRKKISLRLNYILDKAQWVNWEKDKYNLSVSDIMQKINTSIYCEQYRKNIWKIRINPNINIPHSTTSIDRLIRFINYGDNYMRGTGMFSNLEHKYNHTELMSMWQMFCMKNLGIMSYAKIITR